MRKTVRLVSTLVILTSAAWLTGCSNKTTTKEMSSAAAAPAADPALIEQGKQIALSRKKGNCLACHMIEDEALPGNIGPPLIAMKARYPDKAKLRARSGMPRQSIRILQWCPLVNTRS